MQTTPLLEIYGYSDKGITRKNNEDSFAALIQYGLFVIADGIGGHRAGKIASTKATDFFCMQIDKIMKKKFLPSPQKMAYFLLEALTKSNRFIYSMSLKEKELQGMGTTLSCVHIYKNYIICAHVGDSRIYLYRNGQLQQLSTDHTLAKENHGYSFSSPFKRGITQAVGVNWNISPQIAFHPLVLGDLLLLCSDGFSDYVSEEEIVKTLQITQSVKQQVITLIQNAKNNQSRDNITVMMIKIKEIAY
ncbi:MAG: serine/threonine-protein phosphatase [Parachlamydiales bacterium]|nr:serine/threonine-protein phosphatase [Parachlamydiales bacterium]